MKHTVLLVSAFFVGCAGFPQTDEPAKQSGEDGAARAFAEADVAFEGSGSKRHELAYIEVDRYWIGSPQEIQIRDPLPESLDRTLTYSTFSPMSIQEVSKLVTEVTGLQTRVAEDVIRPLPSQSMQQAVVGGSMPVSSRWSDDVELMGTGRERITFSVDGTVQDLLNLVSSRLNISWRVDDQVVIFHRYITKTFQLSIIDESLQSSTTSGEGGEDVGGSENVNSEIEKNVYSDVMDMMAGLMSNAGVITRSPSTSGFTVTDTKDVIDSITREVAKTNEDLTRQVAINVRIYSVSDVDNEEFEFSLDLLYNGAEGISGAITKISDPIGDISGINFNGAYLLGDFAGSSVNYDNIALKENVSIVTRSTNITTNNRTVPIETSRIRNYISAVTTSRSELSSGIDTEIEQDVVVTGLNMQITPKILGDDRVLIHYSINIKDLVSLFERQINDAFVQQPDVTRRKVINQAIMRSGSTLVLTGLHIQNNEYKDSGSWWPWFKLFGGSNRDNASREMAVIMITPVLLGNSVGEPRA